MSESHFSGSGAVHGIRATAPRLTVRGAALMACALALAGGTLIWLAELAVRLLM